MYVLHIYASRDGHTFSHKQDLIEATSKLIEVAEGRIAPCIESLAFDEKIKIVPFHDEFHIYLSENYLAEEYIAKKLFYININIKKH